MTKIAAIEVLQKLIKRFRADEARFTTSSSIYQETEARIEFIDPFFSLLGWDMANTGGLPSQLRDVLREESQITEKSTKKPDYTFRIGTVRKFFVEAKRPSVDIKNNKDSALQTRRYGYTAGHSIAILTNFRTLRIYNTRLEPKASDDTDVGLLYSFDYEEYPSKFKMLLDVLGRDSVANGSIERFFAQTSTGSIPANAAFLNRINNWRIHIAQDLHQRYPMLTKEELCDFSQKIINRIVFIRMCEDRGIEGEEMLRKAALSNSSVEIRALFKRMDDRYNTGLFDVAKDRLNDKYEINSAILRQIIDEVYAPNSPYCFNILDADFLGQVYELFLCQRIALNSTGDVCIENKPAYEHREIVTTPQPLVEEVVRRVFEAKFAQIKEKNIFTLSSIKSLRVFDVAVGSSRFLLRAFDEMINAAIDLLRNDCNSNHLYRISDENYKLDFQTKKEILENCLFGMDIDYNAVEIARFSLLVRLLEDETCETLPSGRKILPDLDRNILNGNTVVETDFPIKNGAVYDKTLPLNWQAAGLPASFDVILGNPPYMKTEEMLSDNLEEVTYYKTRYKTPYKQFDKYFVFVELALSKMISGSWLGMIISNKWLTIEAGAKLREILSKHNFVYQIVNFGNEHLFETNSSYVCLLILTKSGAPAFSYRYVVNYKEFLKTPSAKGFELPCTLLSAVGKNAWLLPGNEQEAFILSKLTANSIPMAELVSIKNGIQTSANNVFLIDNFRVNGSWVEFEKNQKKWKIEKNITRSYIKDSTRVVSYRPIEADAIIIFPYELSPQNKPVIISPTDMQRKYPLAMAYLTAHKDTLVARNVSPPPDPGIFYSFGRHQALEVVFSSPKIIYSVNQKGDKYGIDFSGVAYASGGTAGEVAILEPVLGYQLEFFLGLLNQRAIEFFARKRGSAFGGGWYARGSAVISEIPVPKLDLDSNPAHKAIHDAIVNKVQALIKTEQQIFTAVGRQLQQLTNFKASIISAIEQDFNSIWGVSPDFQSITLPGETPSL